MCLLLQTLEHTVKKHSLKHSHYKNKSNVRYSTLDHGQVFSSSFHVTLLHGC